jgi:hypothetical protein
MKAFKARLRLEAKVSVYIKASFNIDKLFYNELIFNINDFMSFLFGDIYIIYADTTVPTAGSSTVPLWTPPWVYSGLNLCYAVGYNYNDI